MKRWMGRVSLLGVFWVAGCAVDATDRAEQAQENVEESSAELGRPALTKRQEATALKLIDDICGDTWCEGDHNFSFDRLECRQGCAGQLGSCRLTFRVFSYDTDLETGPTYTRSCRTENFAGFDSLVSTSGQHQSLAPDYYDALTQCISLVEEQLPR
jgi:hypothetical protein